VTESPAVADDFRIAVAFEDEGGILHFGQALREREFAKELREQLGGGVVVTRDGDDVFLYASSADQARAAERAAREVLDHEQATAQVSAIERWHPIEQRWEDASLPLPQSAGEVEAEVARQEQSEAADSRKLGYAEWEVRVDLPTHRDAADLAERLEAEGVAPIIRRWKYLLIGTATDDEARALAERIQREAPSGASVKAEASAAIGWELTGRNPFAPFGGFGPGPT
jgi:hypothetical protein